MEDQGQGMGTGIAPWGPNTPSEGIGYRSTNRPRIDGKAILNALKGKVPIVITTAFPEFAADSYDYEAVDYLVKLFTPAWLQRVLRRVVAKLPSTTPSGPGSAPMKYPIRAGEGVVLVDLNKTTHFEVEDEIVWAYAGGRLKTLWTSLSEVEAALPAAGMIMAENEPSSQSGILARLYEHATEATGILRNPSIGKLLLETDRWIAILIH